MTTPLGRLTEDELRDHGPWLYRVARGLVASDAEAEDLAQDVWVELARGSGPIAHLRALSARVARRLAGHRRNTERTRGERERRHTRAEALPGPDVLEGALDTQRLLLEELAALDEMHRTPLLLHYYEGLSAAEIARRRGVPASTVRSQIQRALAELRTRLDRRHGERSLWIALVARLPRHEATTAEAVAGGLLMTALGKTLLVAGVVGVLVVTWRISTRDAELERPGAADAVVPAGVMLAEPDEGSPHPLAAPEATAGARSARAVEPEAVTRPLDVPVLVLDGETAQPLPEFELELRHDQEHAEHTTDDQGRTTIEARWFEAPFQLQLRGDSERTYEDEGRELGREDRPADGELLVLTCISGPIYTLLFDSPPPREAELFASLSAGSDPPVDPSFKASLHRDGARVWTRFGPTLEVRSVLRDGPWTLTVFAKDGLWRAHGPVTTIVGEQREPVRLTAELCGALRVELESDGAPTVSEFGLSLHRMVDGKGVESRYDRIPPYLRSHLFRNLVPGEYQVWANSIVHESAGQRVRVAAGATEEVILALARKPDLAELRVVITSETGKLQLPPIGAKARELATNVWKTSRWSDEGTSTRRVLLFEGLARTEYEVTLDGLGTLGALAFAPGRSQIARPGDEELVFTCLDAGAPPQRTGEIRVLSRAGEPIQNAGVTTYFEGWASYHHQTDAQGAARLESILEGLRFGVLVLADGFRPQFLRDLALSFDDDALEVRLDPGWGTWLDVVLPSADPLGGADSGRPARAAGARVLLDGVPAGEVDELGQILLAGDAAPQKIEVLYPGYRIHYGHIDPETGAPLPHYNGPLWVVLELVGH